MQKLSDDIANEPSQSKKKVMLPNDPEITSSKSRLKNGIPLDHLTVKNLRELSEKFYVPLKLIK